LPLSHFAYHPPDACCVRLKCSTGPELGRIDVSTHLPHGAPSNYFQPASEMLDIRATARRLQTGFPRLDEMVGGLEPGLLHLFYGSEKSGLPDKLLHHLLVEAVKEPETRAIHLLCGNYRRSRSTLDMELLLSLVERAGLEPRDAFSRIHLVCAFTERQQIEAVDDIEGILDENPGVRVVAVQQVSKLFAGPPLVSRATRENLGGMVSRLIRLCAEAGAPVVASASPSPYGRPVPAPEGGAYITHLAKVAVYLRAMKGGGATAYLLNHHEKARIGKRLDLEEGELGLGRVTKLSTRMRLQEQMRQLRDRYRVALKDEEMKTAFDGLWDTWSSEQGAMIYSDVLSALDLLTLTASVDNRRQIETLRVLNQETRDLLEKLIAREAVAG